MARLEEAVEAYELALRIISEHGDDIDGSECAQIAYKGETGDINWLLSWQAPE